MAAETSRLQYFAEGPNNSGAGGILFLELPYPSGCPLSVAIRKSCTKPLPPDFIQKPEAAAAAAPHHHSISLPSRSPQSACYTSASSPGSAAGSPPATHFHGSPTHARSPPAPTAAYSEGEAAAALAATAAAAPSKGRPSLMRSKSARHGDSAELRMHVLQKSHSHNREHVDLQRLGELVAAADAEKAQAQAQADVDRAVREAGAACAALSAMCKPGGGGGGGAHGPSSKDACSGSSGSGSGKHWPLASASASGTGGGGSPLSAHLYSPELREIMPALPGVMPARLSAGPALSRSLSARHTPAAMRAHALQPSASLSAGGSQRLDLDALEQMVSRIDGEKAATATATAASAAQAGGSGPLPSTPSPRPVPRLVHIKSMQKAREANRRHTFEVERRTGSGFGGSGGPPQLQPYRSLDPEANPDEWASILAPPPPPVAVGSPPNSCACAVCVSNHDSSASLGDSCSVKGYSTGKIVCYMSSPRVQQPSPRTPCFSSSPFTPSEGGPSGTRSPSSWSGSPGGTPRVVPLLRAGSLSFHDSPLGLAAAATGDRRLLAEVEALSLQAASEAAFEEEVQDCMWEALGGAADEERLAREAIPLPSFSRSPERVAMAAREQTQPAKSPPARTPKCVTPGDGGLAQGGGQEREEAPPGPPPASGEPWARCQSAPLYSPRDNMQPSSEEWALLHPAPAHAHHASVEAGVNPLAMPVWPFGKNSTNHPPAKAAPVPKAVFASAQSHHGSPEPHEGGLQGLHALDSNDKELVYSDERAGARSSRGEQRPAQQQHPALGSWEGSARDESTRDSSYSTTSSSSSSSSAPSPTPHRAGGPEYIAAAETLLVPLATTQQSDSLLKQRASYLGSAHGTPVRTSSNASASAAAAAVAAAAHGSAEREREHSAASDCDDSSDEEDEGFYKGIEALQEIGCRAGGRRGARKPKKKTIFNSVMLPLQSLLSCHSAASVCACAL